MSTPTSSPRLIVAAGLVWLARTRVLLQRRANSAVFGAGMLEFPGGKVERLESPPAALARELVEEWGPAASTLHVGPIAEVLHHVYPSPGPEVLLCVYHVDGSAWIGDDWRAELRLEPGVTVQDYAAHELPLREFLEADRPFAARIAAGEVTLATDSGRDATEP